MSIISEWFSAASRIRMLASTLSLSLSCDLALAEAWRMIAYKKIAEILLRWRD
jgi:hypothetical protein